MSIRNNTVQLSLESLHNHTTTSDGQLTHHQFLDHAADNDISIVAFTDHDAVFSDKACKERVFRNIELIIFSLPFRVRLKGGS